MLRLVMTVDSDDPEDLALAMWSVQDDVESGETRGESRANDRDVQWTVEEHDR